MAIKTVKINGEIIKVRRDLLHLGQVPRLVLDKKQDGKFVSIHFNSSLIHIGQTYSCYYCECYNFKETECYIFS
jgi:hypothetical protein